MKKSAIGVVTMLLLLSSQYSAAQDISTTGTEMKSWGKAKVPAGNSVFKVGIKGMSCMSCVASVKRTLSGIQGVNAVEVNLVPGEAIVKAGSSHVTTKTLVTEINKLGYKASPRTAKK